MGIGFLVFCAIIIQARRELDYNLAGIRWKAADPVIWRANMNAHAVLHGRVPRLKVQSL